VYELFFIHFASRRVEIAGITTHPTEQWIQQMARKVTVEGCGAFETAAISWMIAARSTRRLLWESLSRAM
jgi:hypothetical protein